LELAIGEPAADQDVWPVGWVPQKRVREVLPAMFEPANIEIDDYLLSETLAAISKKLEAPILFDHYALVRHGIEPAAVKVSFPARRTLYSLALRRVLAQARLKHELRVDEAEAPFIWITTQKPLRDD
jgi:Arc/MetJ family transcription regulator